MVWVRSHFLIHIFQKTKGNIDWSSFLFSKLRITHFSKVWYVCFGCRMMLTGSWDYDLPAETFRVRYKGAAPSKLWGATPYPSGGFTAMMFIPVTLILFSYRYRSTTIVFSHFGYQNHFTITLRKVQKMLSFFRMWENSAHGHLWEIFLVFSLSGRNY